MLIYNDTDSLNIVQSIASASTLISSATVAAKNYIVSNFPNGFFKHIYVDSSEAISQAKENYRHNQILDKIPYPSLTITPDFMLDDPIGGMNKALHLNSPNLFLRKNMREVYKTLLIDPKSKIQIFYTSDYITIPLTFKITVNTYMNNIDTAYYLKSKFQQGMYRYLSDQILATEIPKSFIKCIANIYGWDITKQDDMDKLRLYLIGSNKRENRIAKRVNLATGKTCFYVNEIVDFLTMFADLDVNTTIIKEQHVEGEYTISFKFQISTWLPNAFIMKIDRNQFMNLSKDVQESLGSTQDQQEAGFYDLNMMVPGTSYEMETLTFRDSLNQEQIGQRIYSELYTHPLGENIPPLSIMDKVTPEFKKVHAILTSDFLKGFDLSSVLSVKLYSKEGFISETEYSLDLDNMIISFSDSLKDITDIKIMIFLARAPYEALIEAVKKKKNYFNGNFLSTIIGMVNGKRQRFVVRSFESETDEYTSDLSKSFRVQTNYGTGYVSLKDISDENKDLYRICLGYDEENNPIIKTFEIGR